MIFVDTNYFVHLLLKDVPAQYKVARRLFEEGAKGHKKLFTSTVVIFEIYWVFASFYEKSKSEVCDILKRVLSLNFIEIDQRDIIGEALGVYQDSTLDLEDSYNLVFAKSKKMTKFATFDKKLVKILEHSRA
ncbi:MAG: PilT protein domain protein [Parcubacteria group bacterium GW2011_GWA1_Parcubacteria_45_10]|nr:MAG: PilT protein domain protein [Parcubacteria group bacterium GW2011_GWA1_Parcubacteria_45_10]